MPLHDFSLQIEAFCELGISPELAYILAGVISDSEKTYSQMLILSEKVEGKARELLLMFIERYESVPRELSETVFQKAMVA